MPVAQPQHCNNTIILKADSGASKHFVKTADKKILNNVKQSHSTTVVLPDKTNLRTEQRGTLPISKFLSKEAQQGHVLHGLKNSSLLSIVNYATTNASLFLTKRLCMY